MVLAVRPMREANALALSPVLDRYRANAFTVPYL